ncbi:uncharacterized protein [Oscarella lobularis]|uniref:uncharacterized protein n=1 Tax=Oscarella lobularis TaxID=121494 RepID=UPI0033144328
MNHHAHSHTFVRTFRSPQRMLLRRRAAPRRLRDLAGENYGQANPRNDAARSYSPIPSDFVSMRCAKRLRPLISSATRTHPLAALMLGNKGEEGTSVYLFWRHSLLGVRKSISTLLVSQGMAYASNDFVPSSHTDWTNVRVDGDDGAAFLNQLLLSVASLRPLDEEKKTF